MNWVQFFQSQGKLIAQVEQQRADIKRLEGKLDALATSLHKDRLETKTLVGSFRAAYKTVAVVAALVGAVLTLIARWWVATGGP